MFERVKAFTGPGAERRAEKVGNFFKAIAGKDAARAWCIDHNIALEKASGEGTNVVGGFLTPTDFDDAIINIRESVGAYRQGTDVRPSISDNKVRPRRINGVTATFMVENQPIPESAFEFDAIEAPQKKLAVLCRGSTELFEDSAPDLGEFITSEIGYAFAGTEDDCGFNGDGTSTYSGISGLSKKLVSVKSAITAGSGVGTFATITANDLSNLMGGILGTAFAGAAWYVGPVGFAQALCRLSLTAGPILREPDGSISFLGFPVRFSGKLPDGSSSMVGKPMLYFGNLAMASTLVERSRFVVAVSYDRALDSDQVLVRGVQRESIIVHSVGDANTRGPIAALIGSS